MRCERARNRGRDSSEGEEHGQLELQRKVFSSNGNDHYPSPGARVTGGTLIASRCTFTPGASVASFNYYPLGPQAGLVVDGGSVRAPDCTIHGGNWPNGSAVPPPWNGAPAIFVVSGSASHARCTLLPGTGPFGSAQPTSGNAFVDPTMVGIGSSGALLLGSTWTATATAGTSGQALAFAYWFALAPWTHPVVLERVWGAGQAIVLDLSVPAAGAAVPSSIALPNVGSLVGTQLWCQAMQLDLPIVRASALVGGIMR